MEQNIHSHSNVSSPSELHNISQISRPPYDGRLTQPSGAGVDETASLQAEIDAIDRERKILILKKEKAAKEADMERLRASEHGELSSTSSINTASRAPLSPPAFASAEAIQRPFDLTHQISYGFGEPLEQVPPPYSMTWNPEPHPFQHSSPNPVRQPIRTTHLVKPIAIPATSAKLGSPFMRAYPPHLESYGISRTNFLGFLDDLNRCAVASPPLQVLDLAGNLVGFVPLQTAQIVGASVNLAASVATYGVSKGRTEVCLRAANRALFAPRGLKAEIAKLDALAKVAEIPGMLDPVTGKVNKKASILTPIESLEEAQGISPQQRRLQALERWISPLDRAPLPEIKQSNNTLGRLHTMASEKQRRKEEKKILKGRDKAFEKLEKASREAEKVEKEFQKDVKKLDEKAKEVGSKKAASSGKLEKQLGKVEKQKIKLTKEREKEIVKLEENKRKEDKEEDSLRKILWLVIRNIEDPSGAGPNPDLDSPSPSTPY